MTPEQRGEIRGLLDREAKLRSEFKDKRTAIMERTYRLLIGRAKQITKKPLFKSKTDPALTIVLGEEAHRYLQGADPEFVAQYAIPAVEETKRLESEMRCEVNTCNAELQRLALIPCLPSAGMNKLRVDVSSSILFRSQPAHESYTRGFAHVLLDGYRESLPEIEFVAEPDENQTLDQDWVVYAMVEGIEDAEMIRRGARSVEPKLSFLVDRVSKLWKRGLNPRVVDPFIPHGFEEQHGINYDGSIRANP